MIDIHKKQIYFGRWEKILEGRVLEKTAVTDIF